MVGLGLAEKTSCESSLVACLVPQWFALDCFGFFVDFASFENLLMLGFRTTRRPQQQAYHPLALSLQQCLTVVVDVLVVVVVDVVVVVVSLFAFLFPAQGFDSSSSFAQISGILGSLHMWRHPHFSPPQI